MNCCFRAAIVVCVLSALGLGAGARGQSAGAPAVVQPGAPGQPSKALSRDTMGALPALSHADVEFMQGMIMHHSQAVAMTALITAHTEDPDVRRIGARIQASQTDEIQFMKRWLTARGQSTAMAGSMPGMPEMDMSGAPMAPMPGMLTATQMDALSAAQGRAFDRLFLSGMIQHHGGALVMVKELFAAGDAGQDAEVFQFATDVDNGQRAEIRIMQDMLKEKT